MKKISLSVIMPIFNGEKYLSQSIESVLNQECKDLELLLIDDGSTDNSERICRKFEKEDERVRYYYKSNSGVSDTRNFGINNAQGKFIAFLDCDDVWCKGFYDTELNNQLLMHNESELLSFGFIWADKKLKKGILNCTVFNMAYENRFSVGHMCFSSFIYGKKLCSDNQFNNKIKYSEDFDFLMRNIGMCKAIFPFDKYMFAYRINDNSVTHSVNTKMANYILDNFLKVWVGLFEYFDGLTIINNKDEAKKYCLERIAHFSALYIKESIVKGACPDDILSNLNNYVLISELVSNCKKMGLEDINIILDFMNNTDLYYKSYRQKNTLRIILIKLRINNLKLIKNILTRNKQFSNIKEFIIA